MGGAHHRRARIGHCWHARLTGQPDIVPLKCGCQKGTGIEPAAMIPLFMNRSWQFADLHGLHGLGQGHMAINPFQKRPQRFGVFCHPISQPSSLL